jgi:hypothetical protein
MEIQNSQAMNFMSRTHVTRDELTGAGAIFKNGVWTFPDDSQGRFMPFAGRFIASDADQVPFLKHSTVTG